MKYSVLVLVLAGCGGGGAPGGGGDGGSGGGNGAVGLVVNGVDMPAAIGGIAAASGRGYVTTDLTLTNVRASSAIPAAQIYFTLKTGAGLVLTAAAQSAALSPACATDTSLSTGAMLRCQLAFEVPTQDSSATLDYDDTHGDTASATVPKYVPTLCEQLAAWQHVTSSACASCTESAQASGGACGAQTQASDQCLAQVSTFAGCEMSCESQHTGDAAALCSCGEGCAPSCATEIDARGSCLLASCGSVCM